MQFIRIITHSKMQLISLIMIIFFAFEMVTSSQTKELSAREKIRIHLEWLQKRAELKAKYLNGNADISDFHKLYKSKNYLGTNIHLPNIKLNRKIDSRKNDVYPELDDPKTTIKSIITTPAINEPAETTTIESEYYTAAPIIELYRQALTHNTTVLPSILPTDTITSIKMQEASTVASTTAIAKLESLMKNPAITAIANSESSMKKPTIKKYPHWGVWSKWSECSRSCGIGVMFQERKCISKKSNTGKRFISKECAGLYKRFHLCNEQDCPLTDKNFRQQQCTKFNNNGFQGKKYEWEPYIKDDAECELNCKPVGMPYFATLNHTVIDGTVCSRPAEYYRKNFTGKAICVDGICKAVHASGVITGTFANSGTIPCGGLICRPISGIFTKDSLTDGYNHVATLPAGASNISITELKNSKNLLVLKLPHKNYAFNGDENPSPSGAYEIAGATFDYQRIDGLIGENGKDIEGVTEWTTCVGPIREAVQLMVFVRDRNTGIKYEYLLPITSNSEEDENGNSIEQDGELNLKSGNDDTIDPTISRPSQRRKRKYQWKVVGFSPCSKSCGGGTQTPIIRCVREAPKRFYSARRCTHSEKPILNENLLRCNTQPCPAYWRIEDWEDCRCHHNGEGYREREIRCVQELATGVVIQVNSAACLEEEPISKKKCDCPKSSNRRRNPNRNRLQAHTRPPIDSIFINTTTTPRYINPEKIGTWLISDWNQHCSVECGTGVEYRSIFCDRSRTERCDLRFTPDTTRPCENEKICESGEWFTSPWEQCSGSCFNLTRSRQVICIRNQLIVDDDECRLNDKPDLLQNCTFDDVQYCKPRWHYSSWTDCTKACDGGTQRRTVKCLEFHIRENTLRESQKCRYSEREPIYRSCNTDKCREPRVELLQNDVASSSCIDEFTNCHLVVKARLCSYEYYQQNCCYSCQGSITEGSSYN